MPTRSAKIHLPLNGTLLSKRKRRISCKSVEIEETKKVKRLKWNGLLNKKCFFSLRRRRQESV
ncbi:MAG: hypothetical protein A3E80_05465 [Chlamydiae bacterium RIFCSPHIGHO2_12_FULL_49_9]|nr:MAG: hypothetical protein A3E80_05465 [Chlamydiae bacterium RIFCSPHIGHO2_12_FULL_49_9]